MANPEALPFFAMSLLMGFAVGLLSTYLFLYLDELSKRTCQLLLWTFRMASKQVLASAAAVCGSCGTQIKLRQECKAATSDLSSGWA